MIGCTPYRIGVRSWIPQGQYIYVCEQEQNIAILLQESDYQTFLSGKWRLNGGLDYTGHTQQSDHGFDHWIALHAFAIPNHKEAINIFQDGNLLKGVKGYSVDIFADQAIEYLEHRDEDTPFFIYLFMAEQYSEIASPSEFTDCHSEHTTGEIRLDSLYDRGPGEYYANISYKDDQIGRVLDYLRDHDLEENNMVIYISDNGPVTDQWRYWYEVNMYSDTGGLRGRKADFLMVV